MAPIISIGACTWFAEYNLLLLLDRACYVQMITFLHIICTHIHTNTYIIYILCNSNVTTNVLQSSEHIPLSSPSLLQ